MIIFSETFCLKAPVGHYRVVYFDHFDEAYIGFEDFGSAVEAVDAANRSTSPDYGKSGCSADVFSQSGRLVATDNDERPRRVVAV